MKPSANIFINKCNTAAFELTKAKLDEILHSKTFQLEYVVNMETVKDKTNNIVEIRYKILNKRKDGCEGCDEWYHYNCVGLTRADINKLDPNSPFICVSCNENDLYDPNSDNTIHPISASTEESSTPIILCPDQNDQVLQNQLSQPAPSSQPSITPLQSSDQPTPSVCELSKDTPLTRPKSSSRSKIIKQLKTEHIP
ncbi:unnamed protein product [Mytilus edulis]|uniref:PHD-type domain-containing protein n=1 Tax=Mytilus edulis TaxID=6550 RepID=A0A8S3PQG1_MYTED|nr:unnamed protein product [Mytilus edulis]